MKRIAVLTSGGDAPGMNAAVRGVVRAAVDKGWTALGVRHGFAGLMAGHLIPLGPRDVGGIIQLGGTFLGSARAPAFRDEAGQHQAIETLARHQVDALLVIGGNGSQAGAHALHTRGFPVIGIASTIDNDLHGADITIGVDTAVNVALEALDRLRVTAASHGRTFLVEVMGRDSGYLAVIAGIGGGAELVLVPEIEMGPDEVIAELRGLRERGKHHALVVVAEGARPGVAALTERLAGADLGFDLRTTRLGHVQRGGAPGAFDRLLGSRLGESHLHYWIVELARPASRDEVLDAFRAAPRIALVRMQDGVVALNSTAELMRDLGRPRGDLWEVALWEDVLTVHDREAIYTYQVFNEAIVVPETIDAVRALAGRMTDGETSIARTDRALGMRREFLVPAAAPTPAARS